MPQTDFNQRIIDEFHANEGKVGGFADVNLLLLTTTGARSGREYTTPLVCMKDGDRIVIFASKAGAPTNPDWYHNLLAHPAATVELGNERFAVIATVVKGAERDRLFKIQTERAPVFAEYQKKTTHAIPVVILERVS